MTTSVDGITAARKGSQTAFGELLQAEFRWAYSAAASIAGRDRAEDVLQEAAVRAWRDLPKLRSNDAFGPWFRRIVVRAAIDDGRSQGRARRQLVGASAVEPDHAQGIVVRLHLEDALATLGPEDRAIIALRYGRDQSVGEIARLVGLPEGTAKSRIHRALERMRGKLGEADEPRGSTAGSLPDQRKPATR